MKRFGAFLSSSLLIAACSAGAPEEAVSDASAIAMVEELSEPSVVPIAPQPITFEDIEKNDLFGAGCAFVAPGATEPILLTQNEKGWFKLEGRIVELSSDRSSDPMPFATWSKYVGLDNWLTLSRDNAQEQQTGDEVASAPGELVIHDANEHVVFRSVGEVECGA